MKNKYLYSFLAFVVSIIVGFFAIFIPPQGVIDNSVLWYIAQLLLFTANILGINFHVFESNKNS